MYLLILALSSDPTARSEMPSFAWGVFVVDWCGHGMVLPWDDDLCGKKAECRGGFASGDRVLAVAGMRYQNAKWWSETWARFRPGAVVEVTVWRWGHFLPVRIEVQVQERKKSWNQP